MIQLYGFLIFLLIALAGCTLPTPDNQAFKSSSTSSPLTVPNMCGFTVSATVSSNTLTTYEPRIGSNDSVLLSVTFEPNSGEGFVSVRDSESSSYVFEIDSIDVLDNVGGQDKIDIFFKNARGNLGGKPRFGSGRGVLNFSGPPSTFSSTALPTSMPVWSILAANATFGLPDNRPSSLHQSLTLGQVKKDTFGPNCTKAPPAKIVNVLDEGVELALACSAAAKNTAKTQAIIDTLVPGGTLYFPAGQYRFDGELIFNKRINIHGDGVSSQLFQCSNTSLLKAKPAPGSTISAMSVKDISLGSRATAEKTSLLYLEKVSRSHFENITMQGSYYGIYLNGGLGNYLENIQSDTNIGTLADRSMTSTNQYWIYIDAFNNIITAPDGSVSFIDRFSPNANVIISPQLAGGNNGIHVLGSAGGAGLNLIGGAVEGMSGPGLRVTNNTFPVNVTGVHFEGTCKSPQCNADIELIGTNMVRLESVLVQPGGECKCQERAAGLWPPNCSDYASDGVVQTQVYVHPTAGQILNRGLHIVDSMFGKIQIDNATTCGSTSKGEGCTERNVRLTRSPGICPARLACELEFDGIFKEEYREIPKDTPIKASYSFSTSRYQSYDGSRKQGLYAADPGSTSTLSAGSETLTSSIERLYLSPDTSTGAINNSITFVLMPTPGSSIGGRTQAVELNAHFENTLIGSLDSLTFPLSVNVWNSFQNKTSGLRTLTDGGHPGTVQIISLRNLTKFACTTI